MIYLKITGNAGNQFFQYAFARALQERYGGELVIDYSEVHFSDALWSGSDNLLKDFNTDSYEYVISDDKMPHKFVDYLIRKGYNLLKLEAYTKKNYRYNLFCAKTYERFGVYYFGSAFYPYKFPRQKDILVEGYFESPQYFSGIDDKIRAELFPKHELLEHNRFLYQRICESESVCISIKRMDVDNSEIADIYQYDINYFYNAVKYISLKVNNPVWFIFSDNIDWCRENFHLEGEVHYETEGNPIWEKVRLMSSCRHFIIHNSTFSWWIQHLSDNKDKIVITPVKWLLRDDEPIDIYEDCFTYMDNNGNILDNHL